MMSHGRINVETTAAEPPGERGTATLIAVMILGLLALFTAASLSRVTTESLVMGNDYSSTQSFYAAQASLELMSRNFNNVFNVQLRPTANDLANIQNSAPNIEGFRFNQTITQPGAPLTKPIDDGPFSGLISLRTPWQLRTVATYSNGAQAQLTRTFFNHEIPLFQFGIFYNDDLEVDPLPNFDFGGRVHSNGNIFVMAVNNVYFRSRVSAAGEIVRDTSRMGPRQGAWGWNGDVWVADANAVFQKVTVGSELQVTTPNTQPGDPDMPNWKPNPTWTTDSAKFDGNLLAHQRPLRLPLQIGTNNDPIEIIKRGQNADGAVLRDSRYFNKQGIRVTLSDSQSRLPGGAGGIRLDGAWDGLGGDSGSKANPGDGTRGYQPKPMTDGYQAMRFNGHRLYTGSSCTDGGMPAQRQSWIKVEMITLDPATLAPIATDITADFLSLGLTHRDPSGLNIGDSRAILKMQRYEIVGPPIKVPAANVNGSSNTSTTPAFTSVNDPRPLASLPVYSYNSVGTAFSFVATNKRDTSSGTAKWKSENAVVATAEGTAHNAADSTPPTPFEQTVAIGGVSYRVVPFPIEMYSSREGLYNEDLPSGSSFSPGSSSNPNWWYLYTGTAPGVSLGTTSKVPANGVLSVIDIDMANLGDVVNGRWNGLFPANPSLPGGSLKSNLIPDNGSTGWIVYVSDRRGDRDDDGEFDMEDVYGPNDGIMQPGEDANGNGVLDVDYTWEADRYNVGIETDLAAVMDHKYFRRAVRVINGDTLIGTQSKGYSIASENGLYVLGNFNSTGISAVGSPTQPSQYNGTQVPVSLVADAVTMLSRQWTDAKSFRNPCEFGTRVANETSVRSATLMGNTISSLRVTGRPNQGGSHADSNGGVENLLRFLEDWGGGTVRANYCGSLINLFHSRQHNGAQKYGANPYRTYWPPTRNWVFDTSLLDPNRLPPGTPFFQYVQMTGFRQTVRQVT